MCRKQHECRKDSQAVSRSDKVFIIFLYLQRFIKLDKVSPTPPFFPGSTSLLTLMSPLRQHRGMRNRGCGHPKMLHLSHSCSSVGFFPQEPALHELLQSGSFPWAAVLQELLQHEYFPGVQSIRKGLLQHRHPAGSWVLPEDLCQRGFLSVSCLWAAVSFRARASAVAWALHLLQSGYLLHHGSPWAEGGKFIFLFSTCCKESLL